MISWMERMNRRGVQRLNRGAMVHTWLLVRLRGKTERKVLLINYFVISIDLEQSERIALATFTCIIKVTSLMTFTYSHR